MNKILLSFVSIFIVGCYSTVSSIPFIVQDVVQDFSNNQITFKLNSPPIAIAGDDLLAYVGNTVFLDGSASHDPDGDNLTFFWEQTDGPSIELNTLFSSISSFMIPIDTKVPVALRFRLTVIDGYTSSTDEVNVFVSKG